MMFTQFIHYLFIGHLALLLLSVYALGGRVSIGTRAWCRDWVDNRASVHLYDKIKTRYHKEVNEKKIYIHRSFPLMTPGAGYYDVKL